MTPISAKALEIALNSLCHVYPEGYRLTLATCSLVTSAMRAVAQPILFETMTLDLGRARLSALRALVKNPNLAACVTDLQLQLPAGHRGEGAEGRLLASFLSHLVNLQSLSIMCPGTYAREETPRWSDILFTGAQGIIRRWLAEGRLERLEMSSVGGIPAQVLQSAAHSVRYFAFNNSTFEPAPSPALTTNTTTSGRNPFRQDEAARLSPIPMDLSGSPFVSFDNTDSRPAHSPTLASASLLEHLATPVHGTPAPTSSIVAEWLSGGLDVTIDVEGPADSPSVSDAGLPGGATGAPYDMVPWPFASQLSVDWGRVPRGTSACGTDSDAGSVVGVDNRLYDLLHDLAPDEADEADEALDAEHPGVAVVVPPVPGADGAVIERRATPTA